MKITDHVDRIDIQTKLNGQEQYLEDLSFENLHFARTLRSTIPKGKILNIQYPENFDDITVVDKSDVYLKNEVAMIETDMPIFADDYVNCIGEPIALIVGKDKNRVIEFMGQIQIEYEPETPVFSMEEATKQIFTEKMYTKGNLDSLEGLETFERIYETTYQEQLYMEKQGVVANYIDNRIEIHGSMQCPYYIVNALKNAFGFEQDRIRVIQATTGGAFGGKEDFPSIIACQTALASMKTGAPVRLIFDRREDIQFTTKRHPSKVSIKSYLDGETIKGMRIHVDLDAGPYLGLSDVVLQRAILTMTGAYQIENLEVSGTTYQTNNVFNGAFRGFGAPQSLFALETHMTQLAKKFNLDPLDFRRNYFVTKGQLTSTGGVFHEEIHLDKMADQLEKLSDYKNRKKDSDNLVGYGVAIVPHGGGFTGDGEASHIKAVVKLRKDTEGFVHILVSNVEMGQGALTTLSKIVATALDISMARVVYSNPDTDTVPDSGPTAASRTTMVIGRLLYNAAQRLKPVMHESEEIVITEHYKQPDYIEWDQELLSGNAYLSYSWAALLARVEVDPLTYEISCTDLYGIYDVGIPIDHRLLLGQVHGGVIQGLGYGMMEAMYSEGGLIQQNSFSSYAVPTSADIPEIHTEWLINEYEEGPYGAKAAGELTLVGVAPAIASAVSDAIGNEINAIPVTPEKILEVKKS